MILSVYPSWLSPSHIVLRLPYQVEYHHKLRVVGYRPLLLTLLDHEVVAYVRCVADFCAPTADVHFLLGFCS